MTTLSPIAANTLIVRRPESVAATPIQSSDTLSARPSSVVSLGNVVSDTFADTYSRRGQLPGHESVRAWESDSQNALGKTMGTNFNSLSTASRFNGLGAGLLEQFAKDGRDISQSVLYASADRADNAGELKIDQSLLHSKADNQVSLSIKTASGKTVTFSLSSQSDGLGVQATVDGGELTADELKAVGQLGSAFQAAVDGLTAMPPRLDLSNLTQVDSKVLASVDLNAKLKTSAGQDQTLAFHVDSQSRSTRMSGPDGELDLSVDLKNAAILGNAQQQAKALKSYLAQFDRVQERGNAKAQLMTMFKDAFSAMNSNYPQGPGVAEALTLNPTDQGLLTGLADFKASIRQASESSNPMRPAEIDSFAYNVSQKTRVSGASALDRSITQDQKSSLSASYHKGLDGSKNPSLGRDQNSQNYLYVQVEDKATSSANLSYKNGLLTNASVSQEASQTTRTQKYVLGKRVDESFVPKQASAQRDYLVLLEYAAKESRKSKDALQESTLKDALTTLHESVMLQEDPSALAH
ncbi:lactate dehydrogenase [Pseudomonas sp. FP597]|uniref:lactate dehydrogenase n=1 Tax=Pseudomonas sp. FP597 TaxID=2954096 RepID=UPI0027323DB1|nr:lactate dehydrogenase [Pseudomonas sp. FP597]WLI05492.1 lactate dehydrogenase [Pseudomonas sp. FP597]